MNDSASKNAFDTNDSKDLVLCTCASTLSSAGRSRGSTSAPAIRWAALFAGAAPTRLADPAQSTDDVTTLTLGVTWRLSPASRIMVNHVREGYDRPLRQTPSGPLEDSSNAWRIRVQADF